MWGLDILWRRNRKAADNVENGLPEVVPADPIPAEADLSVDDGQNLFADSDYDAEYDGIDPHADGRDDFPRDPRAERDELKVAVDALVQDELDELGFDEELAEDVARPVSVVGISFGFPVTGSNPKVLAMFNDIILSYDDLAITRDVLVAYVLTDGTPGCFVARQYSIAVPESDVYSIVRELNLFREAIRINRIAATFDGIDILIEA